MMANVSTAAAEWARRHGLAGSPLWSVRATKTKPGFQAACLVCRATGVVYYSASKALPTAELADTWARDHIARVHPPARARALAQVAALLAEHHAGAAR